MSRSDKPKPKSLPSEAIQDYLDLLLAPTADPANAVPEISESIAPDVLSEKGGDQAPITVEPLDKNTDRSESTVNEWSGEASFVASTSQPESKGVSHQSTAIEGRSRLSKAAMRIEHAAHQRPYAEPVKPLTVKMPLPGIQPPPITPEPTVVEVPRVKAPVVEKVEEPELRITVEPDTDLQQDDEPNEAGIESQQSAVDANLSVWMDNGRPSWAQERFECLLFTVGGLTLAVPLIELGAIYPITEEITPLFGQIHWFMGLLTVKGNNIRTVNTAKVVMPERYDDVMKKDFNYVISINGVDWGLAVDSVASAITLEPQDVHWRTERSKRPWLGGTVIEHMCALLDVSQLAAMFLEEDSSRP